MPDQDVENHEFLIFESPLAISENDLNNPSTSTKTIRTYFPETWLWNIISTK